MKEMGTRAEDQARQLLTMTPDPHKPTKVLAVFPYEGLKLTPQYSVYLISDFNLIEPRFRTLEWWCKDCEIETENQVVKTDSITPDASFDIVTVWDSSARRFERLR
jgi:hypothetical protein